MAGNNRTRKQDSVVLKLIERETLSDLQTSFRRNRVCWFRRCPQRLCVPLPRIFDVNGELRRGHVVLGFNKSGRHLISYRLEISTDANCLLPCYAYSLHWWEFDPNKPLVEVFSVPLFDGEEIHEYLYLLVAENQDETKVIVYGEIRDFKGEGSQCQCYVTVCAAPPPRPCLICKHAPLEGVVQKCLQHSFAIHFKYDLLSPFPMFNPSTSLRISDVVIINTGDYLMALKVSASSEENVSLRDFFSANEVETDVAVQRCGACSCIADSPRALVKDDVCGKVIQSAVEENATRCGLCGDSSPCRERKKKNSQQAAVGQCNEDDQTSPIAARISLGCTSDLAEPKRPLWGGDAGESAGQAQRRNVVSGFVSNLNEIRGKSKPDQTNPHLKVTNKTEASSCSKCCAQAESGSYSAKSGLDIYCKENEEQTGFWKCAEDCGSIRLPCDASKGSVARSSDILCDKEVEKKGERNIPTSHDAHGAYTDHRRRETGCGSSVLTNHFSNPKMIDAVNKGCQATTEVSCSCRYESVRTTVLNSNNLTSCICKVYAASDGDRSTDESTEEFDMYDGSIPLAVKTCYNKNLKQVCKVNLNSNPTVRSLDVLPDLPRNVSLLMLAQVTLDLEQCISELILQHKELRRCYKSLKDYDVQLVSVCPETEEVAALARILVYTRAEGRSLSCGLPVSPSPVLQCAGFIFSWNIKSGAVRVLKVMELEDYAEQKQSKFNMAEKEASGLRAQFSTPHNMSTGVLVFSNHTVFTGKSLKYIRHPFLPLVVVL